MWDMYFWGPSKGADHVLFSIGTSDSIVEIKVRWSSSSEEVIYESTLDGVGNYNHFFVIVDDLSQGTPKQHWKHLFVNNIFYLLFNSDINNNRIMHIQVTWSSKNKGTFPVGIWDNDDEVLKVSIIYNFSGWSVYFNNILHRVVYCKHSIDNDLYTNSRIVY